MEEQEYLDRIEQEKTRTHQCLLDRIDEFEQTGNLASICEILRMMAERLPPVVEPFTNEDYETIYGWGGQE